jgi:predicted MFS family arabinose efflux permease
MTIACSIFSFISSVIVLIWLPDSPTQARWASDDEKVRFVERVRSNNQGACPPPAVLTPGLKNTHFKKEQVLEAFTDPYTLLLFLLAFFQTLVVGGINTFNALLLNKAFGFSVLDSQLLSIPLGAMTIVTYMLISYLITKTNQTLLTMIGFTVPNIVGSIVLLTVAPADRTRGGLVVAFYCMQVFQAVNPAIFLMLSRNSAGQTKKSVTYAVTYIGEPSHLRS